MKTRVLHPEMKTGMYSHNKKNSPSLKAKIDDILDRLDLLLPPKKIDPNWQAPAFFWRCFNYGGLLEAIFHPQIVSLDSLIHVEKQANALLRNTEQFLQGRSANHALLTGARGTGKSSLIKSLIPRYSTQNLKLVQVDKSDLISLPELLNLLNPRPEKFIIFCDDFSFDIGESAYRELKTALDGTLKPGANNVLIYATSNRRHLIPQKMSDNLENDEVHSQESIEEATSLADRFGLWLSFYSFDQDAYLAAVKSWLKKAGLPLDENAQAAALRWAQRRGSRNGRIASQFAADWVGRTPQERCAPDIPF